MPLTGKWVPRLLAGLAVSLAAAFVGMAAGGGWVYWNRMEVRAEQATRAELAPLAAEAIPKILGYDYQTVETTLTDVYPMLTPDYRRDFEEQASTQVIPAARDRKVVSQVNVVGQGVMAAHRTSGSVLVYLNRTITDKSKESVVDGARVKVDYRKVDGKWLIDMIQPV